MRGFSAEILNYTHVANVCSRVLLSFWFRDSGESWTKWDNLILQRQNSLSSILWILVLVNYASDFSLEEF